MRRASVVELEPQVGVGLGHEEEPEEGRRNPPGRGGRLGGCDHDDDGVAAPPPAVSPRSGRNLEHAHVMVIVVRATKKGALTGAWVMGGWGWRHWRNSTST